MEPISEIPKQTPSEKKDSQLLFEIIEKMLQQKKQQVIAEFKKKHKKFNRWLTANGYQLTTVKDNLIRYLFATGFSTSMLIATTLPNTPQDTNGPPTVSQSNTAQATVSATPKQTGGPTLKPQTSVSLPTAGSVPITDQQKTNGIPAPKPVNLHESIKAKLVEYKKWPSEQQETQIAQDVSSITKVPSKAVLDGHKMNRLVGFFGAEQHLYRYPGDTVEQHDKAFQRSGIAPGLGAFGYFAPSKTQFTKQDEARERYYIAAQTFLFPGFYSDRGFKEWLRFRKVIVYNPVNGKAVVAVIGDAGPATWTGKRFGGSPEVMGHLQMVDGKQRGEAVVLFVDDPEDRVPLGPVEMQPKNSL